MALTYIKLYHDFLDEAQPLTDAEVGRLVRAMLSHARGDVLPEAYLTGNERFLFPRWRIQIDRDADAYGRIYEANRRNGALGGRPRKDAPSPALPAPKPEATPEPPTLEAVRAFCAQNHLSPDPDQFFHYYQSIGWKAGGKPIADWRAKLREWDARDRAAPNPSAPKPSASANPALDYAQRDYRDEDFTNLFVDLNRFSSA